MNSLAGLLGLGFRSGRLVVGVDRVRLGLQANEIHCVIIAADARGRVQDKVVRLARGRGVPVVVGPDAPRLGAAVGKSPVMVVGVRERSLADGIVGRARRFGSMGGMSGKDENS